MVMIEITEDKFDGLYDNVEKGLRYFGKAMSCLDEMKREGRRDRYGERNRMPDYRGRGGRSGMREHEEYDDMRQRDDRDRGERDYRSYGDED